MTDVLPYVEKNYRVKTDRASRAIAGLSMGGNHTLLIGIPHLDKFAYIGVYSSGCARGRPWTRSGGAPAAPRRRRAAALRRRTTNRRTPPCSTTPA